MSNLPDWMRIFHIKQGIKIHIETKGQMQITRGWGITRLLDAASEYTGKKYKRTEGEHAIKDLNDLERIEP
jgi:hypothetical protein